MLENALTLKNATTKTKITAKTLTSVGLIALAVILPQIVHLTLGQPGGVQFLPMYLPVLIGGCLLGWRWALIVGALSPVMSFLITSLFGEAMPPLVRLPFMIVELCVFALVSGLFSKKIFENGLWAFPAVLFAQVAGRAVFLLCVFIFQSLVPFSFADVWNQVLNGWMGLVIQLIAVPLIVIGIRAILIKSSDNE